MKFRLTYLAGVLAFLCSCTDDSLVNNDQGLRIIGSLETETRTAFVQDDDKTHTRWVEGDQIGIFTDQQSNLPFIAKNPIYPCSSLTSFEQSFRAI